MTAAETIRKTLTDALAPSRLEIVDESHRHKGHAGWRPGGETHFRVEIVSSAFAGCSRVERQRRVYGLLDGVLKGGVHALGLKTLTPEEDVQAGSD